MGNQQQNLLYLDTERNCCKPDQQRTLDILLCLAKKHQPHNPMQQLVDQFQQPSLELYRSKLRCKYSSRQNHKFSTTIFHTHSSEEQLWKINPNDLYSNFIKDFSYTEAHY